jgi:zinc protease
MKHIFSFILLSLASVLMIQCSPKTQQMGKSNDNPSGTEQFRGVKPSAGPAPKIEMGKYEKFTLDNGLQVIVVQNSKLPIVSFQLLVDAPPINQGEYAGYIDFAGEMLSRGTTKRSKAELDEAVDFLGASLNSSGSGIYASSLSKHKEKLLTIMSEVLLNPAFPEDEFEKAKKQTLSGITASKDEPNYIAGNVSKVLRNGSDHPYGEIVTENSVNKITLKHAKDYYTNFWRPNISYLAIVGDISADEARRLATKYFNSWEQKSVDVPKVRLPKFPSQTTVDFVDKPGAVQSVVNITYPIEMNHNAPDRVAASLMNAIFGGVFSSRINMNLREKNAYTYGANSSLSVDRYVGSFSAGASVGNNVTEQAIQELLNEINLMRLEKVTEEEFILAKNVLSGEFARSMERPQTIANYALSIARYNLPPDYYDTYLKRIEAVTIQDVHNAAIKYLRPENARIVVVGNKREVADKLTRFAYNKKVDFYDVNGNKLDEDAFKIPSNITPDQIIQDYFSAIGGRKAMDEIKSVEMKGGASLGGFDLEMNSIYVVPGKMNMSIKAQGQVMNNIIVNGTRAKVTNMGQSQIVEGDEAMDYINQARLFDELYFTSDGGTMKLAGVEIIEGSNCYTIEVTDKLGQVSLHYYDVNSKLKLRTSSTRTVGDQIVVQSVDFKDYKEVNKVKFPFTTKITGGGMPMPLVVKFSSITANNEIDSAIFKF